MEDNGQSVEESGHAEGRKGKKPKRKQRKNKGATVTFVKNSNISHETVTNPQVGGLHVQECKSKEESSRRNAAAGRIQVAARKARACRLLCEYKQAEMAMCLQLFVRSWLVRMYDKRVKLQKIKESIAATRLQRLVRRRLARAAIQRAAVEEEPEWLREAEQDLQLRASMFSVRQVGPGSRLSGGRQRSRRRLARKEGEWAQWDGVISAGVRSALAESRAYAQSVEEEEARAAAGLSREVEGARQVAKALQASREDAVTHKGKLEKVIEAATLGWGTGMQPEERLFRKKCRIAGVRASGSYRVNDARERVQMAAEEASRWLAKQYGVGWKRRFDANIRLSRARAGF